MIAHVKTACVKTAFIALLFLCSWSARADTTYGFVRIACVPETGLLDIEYRSLHDNVVGHGAGGRALEPADALAKNGFFNARGLASRCTLGDSAYAISASQDVRSNRMCGGSPDIYLSVTRNGAPFVTDVVFGESCPGLPSLKRLTLGDGPTNRRRPEAQLCYLTGGARPLEQCEWVFDDLGRRFPLDQAAVRRFVDAAAKAP